jgi:hypothetical protein
MFLKKELVLKSSRLDSTGQFAQYSVGAKCIKPHTIGEELIKPCLLETVRLVHGENMRRR